MTENENDETNITKKRRTSLKIIIDQQTKESQEKQRRFLADLFDFQEFVSQEEHTVKKCGLLNGEETSIYMLTKEILTVIQALGKEPKDLPGYTEEKVNRFKTDFYRINARIAEVTGITQATRVLHKYSSCDESNGIKIYYILFELETSGKTKTEIKTVHKDNAVRLMNYLKMRKVPLSYDCKWEFEGNRACQL